MSSHILIVEDEESMARFIELELMHEGYTVERPGMAEPPWPWF